MAPEMELVFNEGYFTRIRVKPQLLLLVGDSTLGSFLFIFSLNVQHSTQLAARETCLAMCSSLRHLSSLKIT